MDNITYTECSSVDTDGFRVEISKSDKSEAYNIKIHLRGYIIANMYALTFDEAMEKAKAEITLIEIQTKQIRQATEHQWQVFRSRLEQMVGGAATPPEPSRPSR